MQVWVRVPVAPARHVLEMQAAGTAALQCCLQHHRAGGHHLARRVLLVGVPGAPAPVQAQGWAPGQASMQAQRLVYAVAQWLA